MAAKLVKDDLGAGDTLGPYRIEEMLGEGGMGCVFRASRDGMAEPVALKVVKIELAEDEVYRQRFLQEARAATAVQHEHLVNVVDAGEVDGRQYIAMRFMAGKTLEQRIEDDGPLAVPDALRLVDEIGAALDALHAIGLAHRDIKTSNILLGEDGGTALTDFGLAKGTGYAALTRPGQIVGTLDYIAPERIRGEDASPASDMYGLGCVVYECIAGKPPFAAKSAMAVAFAHLEEDPPHPGTLRPELSPLLGEAVLRALAKEPSERPRSAAEYAGLLKASVGV